MRRIEVPEFKVNDVYQLCVEGVGVNDLHDRLAQVTNDVIAAGLEYTEKAEMKHFFRIPVFDGDRNDIVAGNVTKGEMVRVYSQYFAGKDKPARTIYEKLIVRANGKCPFCGFGHAKSLDHYLPKSKYPLLSVLPVNLVPSCTDCNMDKGTETATLEEEQYLHPYYDHDSFVEEQWLFAYIEEMTVPRLIYYVSPPNDWNAISKARVEAHFTNFNLASRYSIQAGDELPILRGILRDYFEAPDPEGIKRYLDIAANSHFQSHANSWQTAMYQALANNEWYCSGGYRMAR